MHADAEWETAVEEATRRCIEECSATYTACAQALAYSFDGSGVAAEPDFIRLLIDCSEICQATQNAMLRRSTLGRLLSAVTVEACDRCAESCDRFAGDEVFENCSEACRTCADCCRRLAI